MRIDGTTITFIKQLVNAAQWSGNQFGENGYFNTALASIDGKLICMGMGSDALTGTTIRLDIIAVTLDANGVFVSQEDIKSAVNPGLPLNARTTMHWRVDNITTPGTPIYELETSTDPFEGTTTNIYQWNGSGNVMTFLGAGKDVWQFSRVSMGEGTGAERIWHGSGTLGCSMPVPEVNGSFVDLSFNVFGANISGVAAGVVFNRGGEICDDAGTIVQTDVGTVEGIFASGIVATPSGTPVTVKWAAASDGIGTGDAPKFGIRVFI